MQAVASPRIKVCCISSIGEAWLAISAGASALGLVSAMPSGPGVISEEAIAEIARQIPPPIATFLLTSLTDVDAIAEQHDRCRTNTIQLCDRLVSGSVGELRRALSGIALVQVVHVTGRESVDEALEASENVHALLLDSGNPKLDVKELGGTGRIHDWVVSREIRERSRVPVFLAGGLRPENVGEAIQAVGPFGVDLCSGVRTDGRLDGPKLTQFVRAVSA